MIEIKEVICVTVHPMSECISISVKLQTCSHMSNVTLTASHTNNIAMQSILVADLPKP